VGSDGHHLRLKLRDGPVVWPAIAFGMGEPLSTEGDGQELVGPDPRLPEAGSLIDVVYSVSADRRAFGGSDNLELEVLDFVPSA
jgi:hypothetical protein